MDIQLENERQARQMGLSRRRTFIANLKCYTKFYLEIELLIQTDSFTIKTILMHLFKAPKEISFFLSIFKIFITKYFFCDCKIFTIIIISLIGSFLI